MPAGITPGQVGRIGQLLGEVLEEVNPSKDVVQERIIGKGGILKARFKEMIIAFAAEYFVLLSDDEAHEWLRRRAGKNESEAKRHIFGYRRGAREHEITDTESCHIAVFQGATMKQTIPILGPCWEDFSYLRCLNFPDPPTEESLFSLIPTLLADSTSKCVDEQRAFLAQVRTRLELPKSHLTGFGSVTHLAGAALTYHKATNRDIFAGKIARTETCDSVGVRLSLRWDVGRLNCARWGFVEERFGSVGVIACGVEKALGH